MYKSPIDKIIITNKKKASKQPSKKISKQSSKKISKTASKKSSKTASKQPSKTASKQPSKTASKQPSKRPSKTTSKRPSKKGNTIKNIKKNVQTIKKKLEDKNMTNIFWVLSDRADFKPLIKTIIKDEEEFKTIIHSIKELRDHLLDEKGEYYKGKKLASIKITFNEDIINKLEKLKYSGTLNNSILVHKDFTFIKEKPILSIGITIFQIDDFGSINTNDDSSWGLKVNYCVDDFSGIKFKLKNVEVLMRLVSDSVVKSDLNNGITYKQLAIQLNKNNKN
jgi:hypothetical protein